jgi:peroxiredoxin
MKTFIGQAGVVGIFLALVFATASAPGQQNVHATIVPQASRKVAPAFGMPDSTGKTVQLSDYRGKVVLLNFWATECGGCKLEIPWFVELEAAHTSDSFTVVGVSMDTSYEKLTSADEAWGKVKPFALDHKMNYPILMGDSTLLGSYELRFLPATFLLDKQGRIAATYAGVVDKSDVGANIKTLLAEQ